MYTVNFYHTDSNDHGGTILETRDTKKEALKELRQYRDRYIKDFGMHTLPIFTDAERVTLESQHKSFKISIYIEKAN